MDMIKQLNPAQQEAATHKEGPLLILAGAGSGKTRVLTTRIAWLLEQGVKPEEILAITFTNKAAREMKERVLKNSGSAADRVWVSTFHSMGNRILRSHIHRIGYTNNFAIYDSDDSLKLHKENIKELGLDDKKFSPRAVGGTISKWKNDQKLPGQAKVVAGDYYEETMAQLYGRYQDKLRRANALDFDDLQLLLVHLFRECPDVLKIYQSRFRYISVDEYQDTNRVQYTLVKMLAAVHRNLCVVGDPDQSIYGWRGADMQNILDFEKDYPDAKVVTLAQNYRSCGMILDAANGVICHNINRKEKSLWTEQELGHKLQVYEGQDENHEAWFIANEIEKGVRDGRSYGDFAALYRTNVQSRAMEKLMRKQGIPFRIYGGVSFYARREIKDMIAYLNVLNNPQDLVHLTRIINVPKRGIGTATVNRLVEYAEEHNIPVYDGLDQMEQLASGPRNKLKKFYQMMESFKVQVDQVPLTQLVADIIEKTGYLQALKDEKTTEAVNRIENLQELLTETRDFDLHSEEKTLEAFLAAVSLYTDMDSSDSEGEKVTLLTMHAAKGLEFPVVFVAGLEEGIFPHMRALHAETEMEEERRLCYVAITRGMERVYLTRAWQRNMFGMTKYNQASRFLEEIPEECLIGSFERNKEQEHQEKLQREDRIDETPSAEFRLGDKVIHAKFGEGIVVQTEGSGMEMQVSIAFPGQGIKIFMSMYAPIRKIR